MSSKMIDATHDPQRSSWLSSANTDDTDFPIQNLPYCVTLKDGGTIGIGIGDQILDMRWLVNAGLLDVLEPATREALCQATLNDVMALSKTQRVAIRSEVSDLLQSDNPALKDASNRDQALMPQADAVFRVPAEVGDYTDFYASVYHATNVGSMFRPDNPLLPNYKWVPIGYHGRASSIVVSGTSVQRPIGQTAPADEGGPTVKPCALLDYELEMGVWVAGANALGDTVPLAAAEARLFGLSLVNDWSARDLQKWEYQPLGPFLAKSFATSISPWIVTLEALAPFRCAAFERPDSDPTPLDYLLDEATQQSGGFDVTMEVFLATEKMRAESMPPQRLSSGNLRDLYWTPSQMLTHHASNGCNLQSGDLFASGTVSGNTRDARGCLLELTWDGELGNVVPGTQRTPISFPDGSERKFLGDGDQVIFRGHCQREGFRRIGFGECSGTVVAAAES